MPDPPPTHTELARRDPKQRCRTRSRSQHHAMYGTRAWQELRRWHLDRNPLCVRCLDDEKTEPGTEVDHVTPHLGNWTLFMDPGNLQSLCKPHHSRKTATEDR